VNGLKKRYSNGCFRKEILNLMLVGVLVGKPEDGRPLKKHRHIWEHNIKMDLREMEWGHVLDRSGSG
jgi:hypothetical protein